MDRMYIVIGVAAVSAGLAGGFFAGKKYAETKFDAMMEKEIEEAKEFYAKVYKREDYDSPEAAVAKLINGEATSTVVDELDEATKALRAYQGRVGVSSVEKITEVSEEDGVIEQNVFNGSTIDQLAVDDRRPDVPYVITTEEFMENEPEHEQITVTYYEGDGVLADERDKVIDDHNGTVGRMNLGLFGLASGDPNVVHVRNELKKLDFEVVKSNGKYAHEVAGFDDIRHSDHRMRRGRNRWDDE